MPLYFSFDSLVWKIVCDTESPLVAVELRNYESREASFAVIDTEVKKIVWRGGNPDELWWTGMEAFTKQTLFLHGYRDIQFPEHKGIWVLTESGKLLWTNREHTFMGLKGGDLYAYEKDEQETRFYTLNPATGKVQKELSAEAVVESLGSGKVDKFVNNPAHYKADNQYFTKLAAFTEHFTGQKAVAAIDYLEYKNRIITSFYTEVNGKLNNHIFMINEEGNKELEEFTGAELSGIGIDTFFVCRDILFFVKNKKELALYYL